MIGLQQQSIDWICCARAFVLRHYGAIFADLDLGLPASIEAITASGVIVVVIVAGAFIARVLVAADGTAQLASDIAPICPTGWTEA